MSRALRPIAAAAVALAIAATPPPATAVEDDGLFRGEGTAYTLGEVGAGNCNMMAANSDAAANYAALNDEQWEGLKNCGRCARVWCDDDRCADRATSVDVQILDRCPECKRGDLDLSPSVFKTLTKSDPSRYKIKWKFVDCAVRGNIKYCLKGGSNSFWTAIQPANTVAGVSSMQINSNPTTMVTSAYYYLLDGNSQTQTDLSKVKVTLTSVGGETVTDTVSLVAGSCTDGSFQFSESSGTVDATSSLAAPSPSFSPSPNPVTVTVSPTPPSPSPAPAPTSSQPPEPSVTPAPTPTVSSSPAPLSANGTTNQPSPAVSPSPSPVPVQSPATPTSTPSPAPIPSASTPSAPLQSSTSHCRTKQAAQ